MKYSSSRSGFTLIEVVVALFILSIVLGGAISTVHQYADQRNHMSNRTFSSQVAWNVLMEQYRFSEGWVSNSDRSGNLKKGEQAQYGRDWNWKTTVEPAVGKDLYRYEAKISAAGSDQIISSLALYIIED
ncbi:MAG: type II secretion system minor pseudopilin GspI [Porticoccaceae bacterium]|nr:type II secretion system minor pseudopilin GspI [Porticoccaceae bacterium]